MRVFIIKVLCYLLRLALDKPLERLWEAILQSAAAFSEEDIMSFLTETLAMPEKHARYVMAVVR